MSDNSDGSYESHKEITLRHFRHHKWKEQGGHIEVRLIKRNMENNGQYDQQGAVRLVNLGEENLLIGESVKVRTF